MLDEICSEQVNFVLYFVSSLNLFTSAAAVAVAVAVVVFVALSVKESP